MILRNRQIVLDNNIFKAGKCGLVMGLADCVRRFFSGKNIYPIVLPAQDTPKNHGLIEEKYGMHIYGAVREKIIEIGPGFKNGGYIDDVRKKLKGFARKHNYKFVFCGRDEPEGFYHIFNARFYRAMPISAQVKL